jgi:hypothetical protein
MTSCAYRTCRHTPHCVICGWGPHAAIHGMPLTFDGAHPYRPPEPGEYRTLSRPPHGKGAVLAYSAPECKWTKVNWKYVKMNPDVYPRWKPTETYRWTGSLAHLNVADDV